MRKLLVGGHVRDHALGIKSNDRDWLLQGATKVDIDKLVAKGYTQIGKDFPVLLHPTSGRIRNCSY